MAVLTKPRKNSKSEDAYQLLKEKLQSGEFRPGERLTEVKVVDKLNMGRMPAREAMLRLEAEGWIKGNGAYGGKYVRFLEDQDQREVLSHYELREAVEALAAKLAAKNMNGWQIDELCALQRRVADGFKKKDRKARLKATADFHRYLLANCGNPLLLEVWETYSLMPLTPRSPAFEEKLLSIVAESVPCEHELRPVVDAIAAHDPDEAERCMRDIVRRITEAIRKTTWNSG